MKKFLSTVALISVFASVYANKVSDSQSKWYEKYKTQENIPKVEEMLINKEAEPDLKTGFVDLYNGKDLSNWVALGGFCDFIANGDVITGTCIEKSPSTYLSTKKDDYTNFIFSCDVKWEIDGNTGIMFRAQAKKGKDKKGKETVTVMGPQAEMEGIGKDRGWSGGVYGQSCGGYFYPLWLDVHAEVRDAIKANAWNRITIKADGGDVKTWLNGLPAAHWITDTYLKGFFSLQIHAGKKGKVHFKNIKVKELN